MSEQTNDTELQAIQQVITALQTLEEDARTRVLAYVFHRLGLSSATPNPVLTPQEQQSSGLLSSQPTQLPPPTAIVPDIRSLKEAKQPKTDNQMAALVAYYLNEVAPAADRKDAISQDDIAKYFKQAGFELPKKAGMTLVNAKNSGYLDQAGPGLYKLNPVGYNLVVHGMPTSNENGNRRVRKSKGKKSSKQARSAK